MSNPSLSNEDVVHHKTGQKGNKEDDSLAEHMCGKASNAGKKSISRRKASKTDTNVNNSNAPTHPFAVGENLQAIYSANSTNGGDHSTIELNVSENPECIQS